MTRRSKLRLMVPVLVGLSGLIAAGCGGDEKPTTTGTGGSTSKPRLSGLLHYEYVPYDKGNDGLDYSKIGSRPIRGARVLLLDATNDVILEETTSSNDGKYSFDWSGAPNVKLWVYAETVVPAIVIADNTTQNAKYVLESAEIVADGPKTLDLPS